VGPLNSPVLGVVLLTLIREAGRSISGAALSDLVFRLMRPSRRLEEPRFEVTRNGVALGHVHQWSARRGSTLFRAFALHPSGAVVCLESASSLNEQIQALDAFADDPEQFPQHLPWSVRREIERATYDRSGR